MSHFECLKDDKIIFLDHIPAWFETQVGDKLFNDLQCPVKKCRLTTELAEKENADLVLFHDKYVPANYSRPSKQIYAMYYTKSPQHSSFVQHPGEIELHFY